MYAMSAFLKMCIRDFYSHSSAFESQRHRSEHMEAEQTHGVAYTAIQAEDFPDKGMSRHGPPRTIESLFVEVLQPGWRQSHSSARG